MSSNSTSVSLRILDKEYSIGCPEGEETALRASADLVNKKILEIKDCGSIIESERIAVMAALNLAHEFLTAHSASNNLNDVDKRISSLKEKIDSAMGQIELR